YSPFSVTFAWLQVSPDKYHTTGRSLPLSACGGKKIEKVMSVDVAADACFTTSCRPPWDLLSETISMVTGQAGADRKACCRRDRADRRGRDARTHSRASRAGP